MYSLSMEIMSFFSFQIRWVQWNPYFTYLLTRPSSLWYCHYPQYSMQRNYWELRNLQEIHGHSSSSISAPIYVILTCCSISPYFVPCLSRSCQWHWFFFLVFNSEINHIKGLIPSLNLIGYSLLENWWVKKLYQLCCLAHRGLREFLVSPKSIWSGTQVLEIFLATSVT